MKRLRWILFDSLTLLSLLLSVASVTLWYRCRTPAGADYVLFQQYDPFRPRGREFWLSQRISILSAYDPFRKSSAVCVHWQQVLEDDLNGFVKNRPEMHWRWEWRVRRYIDLDLPDRDADGLIVYEPIFPDYGFSSSDPEYRISVYWQVAGSYGVEKAQTIGISHLALFAGFLLFPAIRSLIWIKRGFSRRRIRFSAATLICPICNYDLRATPTRCPKCGTPAPLKTADHQHPFR